MTQHEINILQYEAKKKTKIKFPLVYGKYLFALCSNYSSENKMIESISKEIACKLPNKLLNQTKVIKMNLKKFEALALFEILENQKIDDPLINTVNIEIIGVIHKNCMA